MIICYFIFAGMDQQMFPFEPLNFSIDQQSRLIVARCKDKINYLEINQKDKQTLFN